MLSFLTIVLSLVAANLALIQTKNHHVATFIMVLALALILGGLSVLFFEFRKADSKDGEN
jgi:hypothetical protein